MRNIRRLSMVLALCLVLALLPVTSAHAADNGNLWLRQIPAVDGLSVYICADTVVASGVITITYDADVLSFVELVVSDTFVLAHAVNDKKAGTIKISWVGTGFVSEEEGYSLMVLEFVGAAEQKAVLSGTVYDESGTTLAITELDLAVLQAAVTDAQALKAEDYTADSFAPVQTALQEAKELLEKAVLTQGQLDAAVQKLTSAVENLVVYVPEPTPPEPTDPTQPTEPAPTEPKPTEPKPTEPTQPGSTPAKPQPTQPATQAPAPAPQGDNGWMLIVLAGLGVVAIVAAVVILKKRGRK